jgi:hypothetical protein
MFVLCGGDKKSRLRCLRVAPGVVGLGAFAGNPFAVNPDFENETERVRRESEFMLRDRQTPAVSFHGVG